MSKQRAKSRRFPGRSRRAFRGPAEGSSIHQIARILADGSSRSTIIEVPAEEQEDNLRYIEAHSLMPFWYEWDPRKRKYQEFLERALRALGDPDVTEKEYIRAIMILGHSPDQRAIIALKEICLGGGPHAGLARQALQECLIWLADDEHGLSFVAGAN